MRMCLCVGGGFMTGSRRRNFIRTSLCDTKVSHLFIVVRPCDVMNVYVRTGNRFPRV